MKLSPNEHRALLAYEHFNVEWVYPLKQIIAYGEALDQLNVRRAVRGLARKGLLELGTGFSEESGLIAGRGYMITPKGEIELKRRLDLINLTPALKATMEPAHDQAT